MKFKSLSLLITFSIVTNLFANESGNLNCLANISETYCETQNKADIIIETNCKNELTYKDLSNQNISTIILSKKSSRDARSFDENGKASGVGFGTFMHAITLGMTTQIFIGTSTNATVVENMKKLKLIISQKIENEPLCNDFVDSSNVMVPLNNETYKY